MTVDLSHHAYGKHRVRVSKIKRDPSNADRHTLIEAAVDVTLEGDLDTAYTEGDNRLVVATDTCRNTIYVLAKDDAFESIETFGLTIANHFLKQYSHLSKVTVGLCQRHWRRLLDCPHAFDGSTSEVATAEVSLSRGREASVSSGVGDLMIAKTTQSGFENFHRDEYRTLADTSDRILASSVTAQWVYREGSLLDFDAVRGQVREAILRRFIDHYSRSVQETLMFMGRAALTVSPTLRQITLTMPNKHHIPFNLQPFGRENHNDVFVVTDEPYGYITATVSQS